MIATITDTCESGKPKRKVAVTITTDSANICLNPKGYSDTNGMSPIALEVWDGRLRLLVWGDIDNEEPTHIIDLENARKSKLRKV